MVQLTNICLNSVDNACLPKNGEKRDPCNNGGKCEFTDGKVTCVCPTRYDGPTCAREYFYKLLFIEHLSIECRKTKTEVITAANQNELKCF